MKRVSVLLLSAIILFNAIIPCSANVVGCGVMAAPDKWAMEYVSKAEKAGITDGVKVVWQSDITREQFCELAYNTLDKTGRIEWKKISPNPLGDTTNEKVISLYLEDIIEGTGTMHVTPQGPSAGIVISKVKFSPDEFLTREEAAVILERIAKKLELGYTEVYYTYNDEKDIADWAMNSVQVVSNLGVMKGVGNNNFAPKEQCSGQQAVTMFVRMFDMVSDDIYLYHTFSDKLSLCMPDDRNYMFSPLSIKMALLMAANGADGETKQEILDTVGVKDLESYNQNTKLMIEDYLESDMIQLNISNSIWINADKTSQRFSKEYTDKITDVFNATSDVVTDKDAVEKINGWVNEKTNGRILTIINEANKDFWAMLVNAVYFKARWQSEFNKSATKPDAFTSRNGEQSDINFMNKTSYMEYAENDGVQIVKLPYLTEKPYGQSISMYLMMSDDAFNPEKTLDNADFKTAYIALSVPKFEIEYDISLADILKTVGINRAFRADAEFQNMFTHDNMWIEDVIHKTYIRVDEEGTEAAAVTGVAAGGSSRPSQPVLLKYNKPFTFVIRDNINGEILFAGEYAFADNAKTVVSFNQNTLSVDPDFIIKVPDEILMLDKGMHIGVDDMKRDPDFEIETIRCLSQ